MNDQPTVVTPEGFAAWQAGEPLGLASIAGEQSDVLPSGQLVDLYLLRDGRGLAVVHCAEITAEIGMDAGALLNALRVEVRGVTDLPAR